MQRVYSHIRDCILSGRYMPNNRLGEMTLAAELGVSRTPVREALRNLAADGFIELKPHVGAIVRPWNFEELYSSFVIRADIEAQAAAHAAKRITAEEVDELSVLCDRMEQTNTDVDTDARHSRSELNRQLHVRILQISALIHAERTATQLMDLAVLTMTFNHFDPDEVRRSNSDHRVLLRALRTNDDLLAYSVMRTHILTAAGMFRERKPGTNDVS
ncbi:GntR family transcriptional regulator [Tianweitania aestuarii]|nr:GntR family transcriptional regulator [Tianweitania aestuarii]